MAAAGRDLLRATKAAASYPQPAICLPVGRPASALLRPVATRAGAIPRADVLALTEWRNRFTGAFLSEFVADEERTERWLADRVGPDDSRILFMVDDLSHRTIGYLGLAFIDWASGYAEADAVVRGADAPAGLYTSALHSMWRWAREALGLSRLGVRVRSDNSAIAFYEKDPTAGNGGLSLVHMELEESGG